MGYSTDFTGEIKIEPPLNEAERDYLQMFAATRHMHRSKGPFYVDGKYGYGTKEDVVNCNTPPPDQPDLWCQFEPNVEGTALIWNGAEKTTCAVEWIQYIITRFLEKDAVAAGQGIPEFEHFQFNHVLNGEMEAQGEIASDFWKLIVKDNIVSKKKGVRRYE